MHNVTNFVKRYIYTAQSFAARRKLPTAFVVVVVFISVLALLKSASDDSVNEEPPKPPVVMVESVRNLASANTFNAIGTVEALSEARLQTESGGRVTAVYAKIGDTVRAGSILLSLENNSERAALLQAEGSYEAAQAGAIQSDSGVRSAEIALENAEDLARTAARSAYTALNDTVITTIDSFYSNPQSSRLPGVRVSGNTQYLSSERIALQTILSTWQNDVSEANDLEVLLRDSEADISRTISLLDALIVITSKAKNDDVLLGLPLASYSTDLLARRSQLNGVLTSLENAATSYISAKENLSRATIAGTTGDISLANAQVKIALGTLRAAQANFEKTVVRTPITGVINAFYLKVGDYVSPSTPAVIVANNNGLEISTAVSQEDAERLSIGDLVYIEKTATGTISAIAGAVDPTTGKVSLKISLDEVASVKNGDTVIISFQQKIEEEPSEIKISLSAIKMTGSGPVVFEVSDTNELESVPVVLGQVVGDDVQVQEGITLDSEIVVDARGLKSGQRVTVTTK